MAICGIDIVKMSLINLIKIN